MPLDATYAPRLQTQYEEGIVDESLREFSQMQAARNLFAQQCEEVAELILPAYRNTFYFGNYNWPGQKKTERQIDSTGAVALSRFAAVMESLLTPTNMKWHALEADNEYVMKDRATRLWFEEATRRLFKYRYAPHSNFIANNYENYTLLGAFGTIGMFIDQFDDTQYGPARGIRYKALPWGQMFYKENHQGLIDGFIRWFRMTARQCYQRCELPREKGGWGLDRFPEVLRPALESNSEVQYDFLHRVCPRTDYDKQRLDEKGKRWASYYISISGKALLSEGGYNTFPIAASRYEQAPDDGPYGRSPAMRVLPALKTLNAQKKTYLKQAHRAADPVLLTADDGLLDVNLRPGAVNKGGMSIDGKPLVSVLPTGNIQVAQEMMDMEKSLIESEFLVDLFKLSLELDKLPQMTATQVVEIMNQKGILLAPVIGRQQSEYLGPMIDRELDVMSEQGLLPPMPPRLREARGSYNIVYTSPLAEAVRGSGEAAGFMRTVEMTKELVNVTQDQSLLDVYDFDTAQADIARIQSVRESWLSSDEQKALKRKVRAQAQARQEQIQAAPAQAAIIKAQAVAAKAGGMLPAQSPAGGGQPLAQQLGG